ncbi:MAG: hypothetical protein OCD76_22075 [Reichenbachiella sp.]
MTKIFYIILALFVLTQCNPKKSGEKTTEDIALERFEGSYKLGDHEYAKVYSMHLSFEVEIQFFSEPIMFFFEKLDKKGNFIYESDDKNFSFTMSPDHKTGTFYEINEPPLLVTRE